MANWLDGPWSWMNHVRAKVGLCQSEVPSFAIGERRVISQSYYPSNKSTSHQLNPQLNPKSIHHILQLPGNPPNPPPIPHTPALQTPLDIPPPAFPLPQDVLVGDPPRCAVFEPSASESVGVGGMGEEDGAESVGGGEEGEESWEGEVRGYLQEEFEGECFELSGR